MTATLPTLDAPGALDAARADLSIFGPALRLIAARHELPEEATPFAAGSLPVFAMGHAVVKLYAPGEPLDFEIERDVLERLEQAELPLPTPRLLAEGRLDAWRYLVMSRLEGRPLEDVGPDAASMRALGRAVAALHQVERRALPSHVPDYEPWLRGQIVGCAAKQRRGGASEALCAQIDAFLEATPARPYEPAFLHTELGPGHVLARDDGALSGLIDFVEVMVGDPEYDLACVAFFIAEDAAQLAVFLDAYGYEGERGPELARRLLRHLLLHRFGGLAWMLKRRPEEAQTLEQLASAWFE